MHKDTGKALSIVSYTSSALEVSSGVYPALQILPWGSP